MTQNKNRHYSYSLYAQKKFADDYEADRFGSRFGEYLKNLECQSFQRQLTRCHRVLDIGSGTGKLSNYLAASHWVVATDASLPMLRIAKAMARKDGVESQFVQCDAHYLCFKNNSFDAVVSSRVLMHLLKWRCAVQEMCRVSSHVVVVDFPSLFSFTLFERKLRSLQKLWHPAIQTYRSFLINTVAAEFNANAFKVKFKKKMFFFPVAFYRKLNSARIASLAEAVFLRIGLTCIWGSPVLMNVEKTKMVGR
jgi:ubiquinone/menaquinone biosynthesis C-methylase UbiE